MGSRHRPAPVYAVMGLTPPRISPSRPHCVIPFGAVTGRKYHGRLFMSWRCGPPQAAFGRIFAALHLRCYRFDRHLCLLQVVLAYPPCRFSVSGRTAKVSVLLDMTVAYTVFFKEQQRGKYTLSLTSTLADIFDNLKIKISLNFFHQFSQLVQNPLAAFIDRIL